MLRCRSNRATFTAMARHAQIEPAISRLLDDHHGVDTDDVVRIVYSLEPHQHPTAAQRAAVTRGMRAYVDHHDRYELTAGRGPTALRIVPAGP